MDCALHLGLVGMGRLTGSQRASQSAGSGSADRLWMRTVICRCGYDSGGIRELTEVVCDGFKLQASRVFNQ